MVISKFPNEYWLGDSPQTLTLEFIQKDAETCMTGNNSYTSAKIFDD